MSEQLTGTEESREARSGRVAVARIGLRTMLSEFDRYSENDSVIYGHRASGMAEFIAGLEERGEAHPEDSALLPRLEAVARRRLNPMQEVVRLHRDQLDRRRHVLGHAEELLGFGLDVSQDIKLNRALPWADSDLESSVMQMIADRTGLAVVLATPGKQGSPALIEDQVFTPMPSDISSPSNPAQT